MFRFSNNLLLVLTSLVIQSAQPFPFVSPITGRNAFSFSQRNKKDTNENFVEATTAITSRRTSLHAIEAVHICKDELLNMLSATPSGLPTPRGMTMSILQLIEQLEIRCPTPDDRVLASLQGSWELLWTAQDPSTVDSQQPRWISPIENQSYSNNPEGQGNPFLPPQIQRRLQELGLVSATPLRSTQAIDIKNGIIRNIVALNLGRSSSKLQSKSSTSSDKVAILQSVKSRTFPTRTVPTGTTLTEPAFPMKFSLPTRASLSVSIGCTPTPSDPRRVDVKLQSFRFTVPGTPIQMDMPLGSAGPSGWLRTVYIDDDLRISRGHKGSVFVLSRPRRAAI